LNADNVPPTTTGIALKTGFSSPTNNPGTGFTFEITFSEAVTGATDLNRWTIRSACGGSKGVSVTGTGAGPYELTFTGMSNHGNCRINATFDRTKVMDGAGNQLPSGGPTLTVWFGAFCSAYSVVRLRSGSGSLVADVQTTTGLSSPAARSLRPRRLLPRLVLCCTPPRSSSPTASPPSRTPPSSC
jgi:hypothetical protein